MRLALLLLLSLQHVLAVVSGPQSFGSWMSLGLQASRSSKLSLRPELCSQMSGLSPGQQKLCLLYTDHMMHVARGARAGIEECQFQFEHNRWNCSTFEHDNSVFGPLIHIPSKEAAFLHAVSSAGVVHAVSRGCRDGQLDSCGCSDANRPDQLKSEWIWGGCGDNIHYGYKFAQNFIDIRERERRVRRGTDQHARQLMNMHNNEAGRRAVIKSMKVTCKCHGVSGSCSLVTCWQQLAPFRKVGDLLEEKYMEATKVKATRHGRLKVRRRRRASKLRIPTANDLVYLEQSPDYCHHNASIGTLGTKGRVCDPRSDGMDGCDVMCCGRGYNVVRMEVSERCHCKFHWCCYVECKTCTNNVEITVCK